MRVVRNPALGLPIVLVPIALYRLIAVVVAGEWPYLPMLAIGVGPGKVSLGASQLAGFSLALILGSIPFCALGLMVGSLVKGSAATGYANLIYLPGCYLSGLFFPLPSGGSREKA
jgi:ABC-2 type transport system permease protein